MAKECGLAKIWTVGTALAIYLSKTSSNHSRRTTMKFETLMLQSFFAAGLLVCFLTLGAMLTSHATVATTLAASHAPVAVTAPSAG
ncbi:hypothetical protein EC912_10187 [Luteibacter rhizovicinus]|uniref:Uncharacterized protein n=2 Tax=Luteibacter rhizovicinus TaxID=242606 RepID=A0A4R3YX32_9GAMM|nr:hypothetical protein EC912_10187 [Luteibacter rhizovicinus]